MKKKKNMKRNLFIASLALLAVGCSCGSKKEPALKEALAGKFYIGTALNVGQFTGRDTAAVRVIKEHFNAIVPENCMKSEAIQPFEDEFYFEDADRFVAFGEEQDMFITGHTLVWHSQVPRWFFTDKNGQEVSREVMIERIRKHITTLVSRYKGRVKGWDVVNEAVLDDGSMRQSPFYRIIGEDFIKLAFTFAHEADPDAELYYNDYSMSNPAKRDGVVRLVKSLQEAGVRIDGIGMQGHLNMAFPPVAEFEKSLLAFSALGVKVMITEFDLSALPSPRMDTGANISDTIAYKQALNPYPDGLPEAVEAEWTARVNDFFQLFLKHQDKISRVTLWGVSDAGSWLNDWPIPGRTNYPLFFDRDYQPKPVVQSIIRMATNN